jgi:hypothetical protein
MSQNLLLLQGVAKGFIKCAHEVYAQEMLSLQTILFWWLQLQIMSN